MATGSGSSEVQTTSIVTMCVSWGSSSQGSNSSRCCWLCKGQSLVSNGEAEGMLCLRHLVAAVGTCDGQSLHEGRHVCKSYSSTYLCMELHVHAQSNGMVVQTPVWFYCFAGQHLYGCSQFSLS